MVTQLTGACAPIPLTGQAVGRMTVDPADGAGGVVPPLGHPLPPDEPDQQQSMLSMGRPPSGTVRLSASSWITPSVKSDWPIKGALATRLPPPVAGSVALHAVNSAWPLTVAVPEQLMSAATPVEVVVATVKPSS